MLQSSRAIRVVLLLLVLAVIGAAVAIPLTRRLNVRQLLLGQHTEVVIDCSSAISVAVEDQQARVRCAQGGELAVQPTTAASGATTAAGSAASEAPSDPVLASAPIFVDELSGWSNWSWGSTIDPAAATARDGKAVSVTYTDGWSALYLHADRPLSTRGYDTLRFWANGGEQGGQQIRVCSSGNCERTSEVITLAANTWTSFDVPLRAFGNPRELSDLVWQDTTGGPQATYFLDDIALVATTAAAAAPAANEQGPTLALDANGTKRPISPLIYGINFPDEAFAKEIALPVQRWGGNAVTRYNWQNDVSNRAKDWFFLNVPNDTPDVAALPKGSDSDEFVAQGLRTGTATLLTVPMIGWTPKSRDSDCGFSVERYGPQQQTEPNNGDCGNGLTADEQPITGNDPTDTSVAIGPEFVADWIEHLKGEFGTAKSGGVAFYNLDNEPFLWHDTHRDVRPEPLGYDELRDLTYTYGAAVKKADPDAQTLGPAEWGWTNYFYSAKDGAGGGNWFNNAPDRAAHGGTPFAEWYLQQMREYEEQNGTRILDYFDLHYYPQQQGVMLGGAGDEATQDLRLRSTRALWDESYKDESWIDEPVRLIPRMREWVDKNYPGTKLAIGEYNFGGLEHINGAIAQADVLGIFGREGLDLATIWAGPAADQPGAFAFRMFRNYDGKGAQFGDMGISATSSNQEQLAIYAAERSSDGATTVIVINKTNADLSTSLALGVTPASSIRAFRYSEADLNAILLVEGLAAADGAIAATFPAYSITVLELA